MGPSKGGIFIKLITMSKKLHQSHSISTSSVLLRRFSSIRDFNLDDDRDVVNGGGGGGGGKFSNNNSYQEPPEPIPNRPLRGPRPERHINRQQQQHQIPPQRSSQSRVNDHQQKPNRPLRQPLKLEEDEENLQSDENFLDKFKLTVENKTEKPQFPKQQEQKTNRDQPPVTEPPEDADEIFKKMKETGLIPNAVAMLDGLCKDGLVQDAMKLFGQMREKGTIPEVVIYTAVIDGFCKAQKFGDAERIFRKMQTNGISPNAFSYSVLIQGLYKSNKLEDAVDFCIEMLEAGHSPNVTTFVGLVDGLCREKGVEEAQGVIAKLREKGFLINDKAVREFLDKKAPFSSTVWEAIFGKKTSEKPF